MQSTRIILSTSLKCLRLEHNRRVLQACRKLTQHRYSTEAAAVAPPYSESGPREYSPKIQGIVDDIGHLTLIEVADLNDLLKKTLNIKDAPMMAMGAAVAAPADTADEEDAEPVKEKSLFTVKLTGFKVDKKIALIKEIKALIEGMNLVQAKKFVESTPQVLKKDLTKEEAEKLKEAIAAAGGEVELD